MGYPVSIAISQGETFAREVRIVGEDITAATLSIDSTSGISPASFTLSKVLPDTVKVISITTSEWAPGTHEVQLHLTWPSGDVREEIVQSFQVTVRQALDFWLTGTGIIDGGLSDTVHEDVLDGGGA